MHTGTSIAQVIDRVATLEKQKEDFIVGEKLLLAGERDGQIIVSAGDRNYSLTDVSHSQLGDQVKIPRQFYNRLKESHPDLLVTNINRLLGDGRERFMVRTYNNKVTGEKVLRALLSDKYRRLDNMDLLAAILPAIKGAGFEIKSSELTEKKLYLKAVSLDLRASISPDGKHDKTLRTVHAGFTISNSEVGAGSVLVEPFVYDLVCTNGLIVNKAMRKYHIGKAQGEGDDQHFQLDTLQADDKAFWLKVRDTIATVCTQTGIESLARKLYLAQNDKAEDVEATMEKLTSRFAFNDSERDAVLKHWLNDGDGINRFGVLNAVTRTAEDLPNYDRATEFERMGGELLNLSGTEWGRLSSAN